MLPMPSAITLNEEPILIEDDLPVAGQALPFFSLVDAQLQDVTLAHFDGQRKLIHLFPSVEMAACAHCILQLESLAAGLQDTALLHISADLPFTSTKVAQRERLQPAQFLSTLRGRDMLKHYGVLMVSSHLAGLPAHALIVADAHNTVLHSELVADLTSLPDLDLALGFLR